MHYDNHHIQHNEMDRWSDPFGTQKSDFFGGLSSDSGFGLGFGNGSEWCK